MPPLPIEDYALLGDTQTAALVSRSGSIDWLCLPRFDSAACFAALLGEPRHGRWLLTPAEPLLQVQRRYRPGTLVLETDYVTAGGRVRVVDCMPPRGRAPDVVRLVEGLQGEVPMRLELVIRFDYGHIVPWVRSRGGALSAVAGPDALVLRTPVPTRGEGLSTVADFRVRAGERVPFVLTWHPSHTPLPPALDAQQEVLGTQRWWERWSAQGSYRGPWEDEVRSSLVALKALTYAPTGGIVAAATTSLPEWLGGVRNWDYRYCWLRDATFTLTALTLNGYRKEASAWRDWLLRSLAGDPSQLRIMYGVAGERRLPEYSVDWLPGYAGSRPVRVGNAASTQLQLDVYGEVMDALHQARRANLEPNEDAWRLQQQLMHYLEGAWQQPDEGLWEVRGPRQHFTHSKLMTWVAFDRAVKAVEQTGLEGPVDAWRAQREAVHRELCERGYDPARGAFVQAYGSRRLDASLLLLPLVGFLPPEDPRVQGTVRAIERELLEDGFVLRYSPEEEGPAQGGAHAVDGLPGREGAFLACSFWLADNYALAGRQAEAEALFRRLLALRNDVGLLSEEYDARAGHLLGNFPQAFSHVGLVNTALNLTRSQPSPARSRKEC